MVGLFNQQSSVFAQAGQGKQRRIDNGETWQLVQREWICGMGLSGKNVMANNVEWKATVRDAQRQQRLAEELARTPPRLLEQVDTYFKVSHGRLKLRRLAADYAELIHYFRPDHAGPKLSEYSIVPTSQPDLLRELLKQALGMQGEVRKRRWLYLVGQARIHLDEVDSLGTFLEVEVVLQPGQTVVDGEQIAELLRRQLEVRDEDLIEVAYLDLIVRRR